MEPKRFIPWKVDCSSRTLFYFVLIFICLFSFGISCASLLPPERRVYPKNPVLLPDGMDIHQWMETKMNQFPGRLRHYSPYDHTYKIMFYRKQFTNTGSFVSCGAFIRPMGKHTIEILEMVSNVNYEDYTVSTIPKRGVLGPMNEVERTEILLPCIEEFLEIPTKLPYTE